jgi:hypothetical protein
MNDLAEFLLARIADDEAVARLCAEMFPSPWEVADRGWRVRIYSANVPDESDHAEPGDERAPVVMEVEPSRHIDDPRWLSERVEHVRRHDPARVLAECDAKRRIVDAYRELWVLAKNFARAGRDEEATTARNMYAGLELAMQCLALPYASHHDYRPEWRP